jgi:hypothetical protein
MDKQEILLIKVSHGQFNEDFMLSLRQDYSLHAFKMDCVMQTGA